MELNERHQKIIDLVRENLFISSQKLSKLLYVSTATIRRDLVYLSDKGLIKRSHGGAVSIYSTQIEYSNYVRTQAQIIEKKKIAAKCYEYLDDGLAYFIDSSTTVSHVIPYFGHFNDLTIVTNGIDIAEQLSVFTQFHLFLTCGRISFNTNSAVGADTVSYINRFNCNIFLFSCNAISADGGVMEADYEQMETKQAMLLKSKKHILLVDHTKFGKNATFKTCDFSEIDVLITDAMPDIEFVNVLERNNVKLVISQ